MLIINMGKEFFKYTRQQKFWWINAKKYWLYVANIPARHSSVRLTR